MQFSLTSLSILLRPSHSFILALSIYRSLETPVRQIRSFVSLSCNHISHLFLDSRQSPSWLFHNSGCTPQIATARITLQYLISLCMWNQFLCVLRWYPFCFLLAWKNDSGPYLAYARWSQFGCVKNPTQLVEPPRPFSHHAFYQSPHPLLRSACWNKMAAFQLNLRSAKGLFAWTCVPPFSWYPTVTISQRGVKSCKY